MTGLLVGSGTNTHVVKADVYVAALDVPGAKRLIPTDWRKYDMFDKLHTLVGVPVITVQLRYNGWVTEMKVRLVVTHVQGQVTALPSSRSEDRVRFNNVPCDRFPCARARAIQSSYALRREKGFQHD